MNPWKWLSGGKNLESTKNLLVIVVSLLAILTSQFWAILFTKEKGSVKIYGVGSNRLQVGGATATTTHLKDVPIDLSYQVDYLLVNEGASPIEVGDYIEPITVEGTKGPMVLGAGSKSFEDQETSKTQEWPSEDGLKWKMPPTFLNPGDRIIMTLFVGAKPKADWLYRDIYEGVKWSGKIRGSNLQVDIKHGGKITATYVAWYLCGAYVSYYDGEAHVYLLFVFVFFFAFMWFLLPKVSILKSRVFQICAPFLCLLLALAAADGTYTIIFPSHIWGNSSKFWGNWVAVLVPILIVFAGVFLLPGKPRPTKRNLSKKAQPLQYSCRKFPKVKMYNIPEPRHAKTGIHPDAVAMVARPLTKEERIRLWFIRPLMRMRDDDGFVALLVCLPLLERIIRFRCGAIDDEDLKFSEGSKLTKELAVFLQLSEQRALAFWQQFRNGLLHRAMIKPTLAYQIDPDHPGNPVTFPDDNYVMINVWRLRDLVVQHLEHIGTKLWRDHEYPIPEVYLELFPDQKFGRFAIIPPQLCRGGSSGNPNIARALLSEPLSYSL